MLILISYDLKQPDRDYATLYEAIKSTSNAWWHYLESVWLVDTQLEPEDCYRIIRTTIDENDSLFIVDITGQKNQGWLPSKAWEWIKLHNHS